MNETSYEGMPKLMLSIIGLRNLDNGGTNLPMHRYRREDAYWLQSDALLTAMTYDVCVTCMCGRRYILIISDKY